ncbi:MAG: hypothetical protein JXA30_17145 [Deltaproteobacteria bacterium]|nr:hypothetical protein [Deltaproteobacteria bacterium]
MREPSGELSYDFKTQTGLVDKSALDSAGVGAEQSLEGHMRDPDTGRPVQDHSHCSKSWNRYRGRFIKIAQEVFGESSFLGELWFVEGDTPVGPWVYARKIVTHDDYSFYNPRQHPFFDQRDGRFVYFEGTYSYSFSAGTRGYTPRYDYNQIMYRLDLADPRLNLPVAVYDLGRELPGEFATKSDLPLNAPKLSAAFFASDRPGPGLVKVAWSSARCAKRRLVILEEQDPTEALFYALPLDAPAIPPNAQRLYEYQRDDGRYAYSVDSSLLLPGFAREK